MIGRDTRFSTTDQSQTVLGPLQGLRVLEIGGGLAAAYATKLLVDLGAQADVLEPAGGCPLRGGVAAGPHGSRLFQYLRAGCSSVLATAPPDDTEQLRALCSRANITISSVSADRWARTVGTDSPMSSPSVVVHVSPFGLTGPRSGLRASSLTLQAAAGWPRRIGAASGMPCFAGGDVDAFGTGVHVAVAALTAWRHARTTLTGVVVDVSAFECLVGMLPYPTVHAEVLAAAGLGEAPVVQSVPGVVACADGWVGINPLNQQGWNDLCEVVGLRVYRDRLREVVGDGALDLLDQLPREEARRVVRVLDAVFDSSLRAWSSGRATTADMRRAISDAVGLLLGDRPAG